MWDDVFIPGQNKNIEIEYQSDVEAPGRFLNVHVDVPEGKTIDLQVRGESGGIVGRTKANSGTATASVLAQGGHKYRIIPVDVNRDQTSKYNIWVEESEPTTVDTKSILGMGGIDVRDSHVYVASPSGLRIYEIEGDALEEVALLSMSWARDVVIEGNYAFVADGLDGLVIVDVSNPLEPVEVGFHASRIPSSRNGEGWA